MKLSDKIIQVLPADGWTCNIQDDKTPSAHWHHQVVAWALTAAGELKAVIADRGLEFADSCGDGYSITYEFRQKEG